MKRSLALSLSLALLSSLASCGKLDSTAPDAPPASAPAATQVFKVPVDGAPALGDAAAPATLVFYSDYQCPFCARAHANVSELRRVYGKRLRIVVRHNPLPFHDHARAAARAAFAAGEQGKFWEMDDKLYANARALDDASLARMAGELGLDVERFLDATASKRADEAIDRDLATAQPLGVRGTPTLFVNGRKLVGARPIDEIERVVDEEIARAEALVARGVRPADVYATLMKDALATAPPDEPKRNKPSARGKADPPEEKRGCDCALEEADDAPGDAVEDVPIGAAPVRGPAGAAVAVVVYSDFECPFCRKVEATIRDLQEQYRGRVKFVFKNNPLPFHQSARLAARAGVAAAEQGKFWEYHDALFAHADQLDRASLERFASEVGLDVPAFRRALDADRTEAAVAADVAEAARLRIEGAPTFFVNGRRIIGAQPLAAFRAAVEKALSPAAR